MSLSVIIFVQNSIMGRPKGSVKKGIKKTSLPRKRCIKCRHYRSIADMEFVRQNRYSTVTKYQCLQCKQKPDEAITQRMVG